jgi:hypothetical protein
VAAVAGVSSIRAVRSDLAACLHAQALVYYDLAQWQQCLHTLNKKLTTLQQLTAPAAANDSLNSSISSNSSGTGHTQPLLTPLEGAFDHFVLTRAALVIINYIVLNLLHYCSICYWSK